MDWQQAVTLGIALLGAALGILNTWQSWRRDRTRLVVDAAFIAAITRRDCFNLTARNRSPFAITIEKLHLSQIGGGNLEIYCRGLPVSVEARAPATLLVAIRAKDFDPRKLIVEATTACGARARGRVK